MELSKFIAIPDLNLPELEDVRINGGYTLSRFTFENCSNLTSLELRNVDVGNKLNLYANTKLSKLFTYNTNIIEIVSVPESLESIFTIEEEKLTKICDLNHCKNLRIFDVVNCMISKIPALPKSLIHFACQNTLNVNIESISES